ALGVVGLFAAIGTYVYLEKDLPNINSLADYRPIQTTKVFSDDGYLVAELYEERRVYVSFDAIPERVVRAFLAAEDSRFYEHEGLDYLGILRAAIKNLRPGAHLQGASTITQQTVKTMVLGPERSYWRKMREAILSRQLESMLTKEEILTLYLNQIYFGAGAYGVEEAARTYFGKSVRDVSLGEAALLASIPKNPSRYTPRTDPDAAKERQKYVLGQMVENGWVTEEDSKKAIERPVPSPPLKPEYLGETPHYVELVRRQLIEQLGEEELLTGGYTVYTAMSAPTQVAAQSALRRGLEEIGHRHGYPGARARIEVDRLDSTLDRMHTWLAEQLERRKKIYPKAHAEGVIWDLSNVAEDELLETSALLKGVELAMLDESTRIDAVVSKVDPVSGRITVDLGTREGIIEFESLRWARPFSPIAASPSPKKPGDVAQRGDVVTVRVTSVSKDVLPLSLELVSIPKVEGALVALDQHSRYVRALVGGYTMQLGGLIRATQSRRQPGSAFKPIVYTAGITEQEITPASTCADTPIVIRDQWTGQAWKPENYEDGRYDGNITYRRALTKSKNTCSVKLIDKLGPEKVIA
ncbi:MAG: transglycosylase domain-containing protein, partial [Myxococcota bacterium]